jgi:hypothetical protein
MPLTYNGFFLGTWADLDPTEGNNTAENAASLNGQTFGAPGQALANNIVSITAQNVGGNPTALDQNNAAANDRVIVDDGNGPVTYTFDSAVLYNATLTYIDGTTASVQAIVFQTTTGELFLAPSPTLATPWNSALTAAPLRSITFNSVAGNTYAGLSLDRALLTFPTCFTRGTPIATRCGPVPVERLRPGDLVETVDDGWQPVRWIGGRRFGARALALNPALAAVRIRAGALGAGRPARDILVSQQHRVLLRSRIAGRMFDAPEVLVAARHLLGQPGVTLEPAGRGVDYWHFALPRHSVVRAEGLETETLYAGPGALRALAPAALAELRAVFPELAAPAPPMPEAARPLVPGRAARALLRRHARNGQPLAA